MSTTLAPELPRVEVSRDRSRPHSGRTWLVLACIYLGAVAYHVLNSLGHRTPAVFTDELLFAKLAQALAAGDGFLLRGEVHFFPAPVAVLVQALAWLAPDAQFAYELAKVLNAAVMATAVFPAYWLARQLTSRASALLVAAAAVAAPGLLYHSYLMTDAAGYPAFLLAVAVMTRALARPSARWEAAVLGASALAVLCRTQFVVLPLAYLLAVGVVGLAAGGGVRASYRRHGLSCGTIAALGVLGALTGGVVLGQYLGAKELDYPLGEVARWTALNAGILPFSAGWLVVPGALLGTVVLLARPSTRAEAGFAALAAAVTPLMVLEAALIATGDAHRVMERYLVCLVPLAFVAFLAYVERGAPHRYVHAGLALALGLVALVYPLATEADYRFSFDSPTMSAYGELAWKTTEGDAAAVFAGVALLGSLALTALAIRRRAGTGLAIAGICLLTVSGAAAYAADRAMTERTLASFAAPQPDWLDESGLGATDYLALPYSQPHAAWNLETWNRDFGVPVALAGAEQDGYTFPRARVREDGRLVVGDHALTRTVVVGDYGSAAELVGRVVLRPRGGLTVWRLRGEPRIRSLAEGVYHDGWASGLVRYRVWPQRGPGVYRVRLELPRGRRARTIELNVPGGESRTVTLNGGDRVSVSLRAAKPAPLELRTDQSDFEGGRGPTPRLVAVRISDLSYSTL